MNDEIRDPNADVLNGLLVEFKEQRDAIKAMIVDLDKIKATIDNLFPEKLDKRYMRFFEEKVKSTTGLFNALLDMRKEISKSLKDEVELRRRMIKDDLGDSAEFEDLFDIRKIVRKVEKFQKQTEELKKDAT